MYLAHILNLHEGQKGKLLDGTEFTVLLEQPGTLICGSEDKVFVLERNPNIVDTRNDLYVYIVGEQEDGSERLVHVTNLNSMITHIAVEKDGYIRTICSRRWNVGDTLIQDTIVNCESCLKTGLKLT